ncbi:MAG: hypothetical protein HYT70_01755 [Candidatus Aenigmarchaeota archaeon]|nr:hypothetical protein [Candidatus Aenigmarchaeota archaeon]
MPKLSVQLSKEEMNDTENMRKIDEGGKEVDNFLLDNVGDMTYAGVPAVEIWRSKKLFKYPVKSEYKNQTLGHIYIDPSNMQIIEDLSDSVEKIRNACAPIDTDD